MTDVELSIVIPCYNEAAGIETFWSRLTGAVVPLGLAWEAIFVNDGSTDATLEAISRLPAETGAVQIIDFSRNFGKEAAITAGLDHARGAAVIIIDADLQHPPEVIPEMVRLWRQGTEVVLCKRESRDMDSPLRAFLSGLFYKLSSQLFEVKIPRDVGDFRLLDRAVVDALSRLRENQRFMKGLFAWIGFPAKAVRYDRAPRAAGETKWNYWKLWNFSLEGITSFTVAPLKVATYLGLLTAIGAVIYLAQLVFRTVFFGNPVAGYPSLLAVVLFLGGVQMMMLGIIGEYLGRIFNETKQRPLYIAERYSPSRQASRSPSGEHSAAKPGIDAAA